MDILHLLFRLFRTMYARTCVLHNWGSILWPYPVMNEPSRRVSPSDAESSRLQEVERRLAVADFGPDFVPTDPTHLVKRQGVLGLPLAASHTVSLCPVREYCRLPVTSDVLFGRCRSHAYCGVI